MAEAVTTDQMARQIWLLYYNDVLFKKGILSEKQYRQMMIKIKSNTGRK